jgi:hypothetical protein
MKIALQLSGSDITFSIKKSEMVIHQGGIALPVTIGVTLMDAEKVTLPISKACGKGSTVCDEDDYSSCGAVWCPAAQACKILCQAIKSIASSPALKEDMDLATLLPAASVTCGSKKCLSLGDTSAACVAPAASPAGADGCIPSPTTNCTLGAGIQASTSNSVIGVAAVLTFVSALFL